MASAKKTDRTARAKKLAMSRQLEQASNGQDSRPNRKTRAEKRTLLRQLEEANKRIRQLEEANDILTNNDEYLTLEDRGTSYYQDCWDRAGCSRAVAFPSPVSCLLPSIDDGGTYALNCMPGVCGQRKLETGYYSQPIWMKGSGYTLVGLVGTPEEKDYLKKRAGMDFRPLPFMKMLRDSPIMNSLRESESYYAITLSVDMVNHTAQLYGCSSMGAQATGNPNRKSEPLLTWENLPDEVWVAIAMKRNSGREAVFLPCTHWDVQEIEH